MLLCHRYLGMFVGGIAVGFAFSWQLTLVIFSVAPLMAMGGALSMCLPTHIPPLENPILGSLYNPLV